MTPVPDLFPYRPLLRVPGKEIVGNLASWEVRGKMTHQRHCWPETGSHSADLVGRRTRGSAPGGEEPAGIREYRTLLGVLHSLT